MDAGVLGPLHAHMLPAAGMVAGGAVLVAAVAVLVAAGALAALTAPAAGTAAAPVIRRGRTGRAIGPRGGRLAAGVAAAAALMAAQTGVASAHVLHTTGAYTIALGWLDEPAYAGQLNAVEAIVKTTAGAPVSDLDPGALQVQIGAVGRTGGNLPLQPSYDPDTGLGTPGQYLAWVEPTVPGNYTFHLSGSVHGTAIDETYTSGPTTFDTVHDIAAAQFPPGGGSGGDVSALAQRAATRAGSAENAAAAASSAAADAASAARRGEVLGVVALVLAPALGGAALALALRGRRTGTSRR